MLLVYNPSPTASFSDLTLEKLSCPAYSVMWQYLLLGRLGRIYSMCPATRRVMLWEKLSFKNSILIINILLCEGKLPITLGCNIVTQYISMNRLQMVPNKRQLKKGKEICIHLRIYTNRKTMNCYLFCVT